MIDPVVSLECFDCEVPLPDTIRIGNATVTSRSYVIVRLHSEQGIEGVGLAYGRGLPVAAVIRSSFAPLVIGTDSMEHQLTVDRLRASFWPYAEGPLFNAAVSAVDLALWDLACRRHSMPLSQMLGRRRRRVPLMAVADYSGDVAGDGLDQLETELRGYRDAGFRSVKLVIGMREATADQRRIAVAREVLGPDIAIAIDAFRSFHDVGVALDRVLPLAKHHIAFLEDPMIESLEPAVANLRARSGLPIALGECLWHPREFRRLITSGIADVIRLDATVVGGVRDFLEVASLAAIHGLNVSPHFHPEVHIHLAAAVGNLHPVGIEYMDPDRGLDAFRRLLATQLEVVDGEAVVPDRGGLGLDFDWDAINRFAA